MSASAYGVGHFGWESAASGSMPTTNRDVLVWNALEYQPQAAFFDSEEGQWFCKLDGLKIEDGAVTHWCEIQIPEGAGA